MASLASSVQRATRWVWSVVGFIVLCGCLAFSSPAIGRRMVCWQAIMLCQGEAECNYAYEQYIEACLPMISGDTYRCPRHCISALIQLNHTKNGPYLENCDCVNDERCKETKRAIEPCMPRTNGVLGCTEARRKCDLDPRCNFAMRNYLMRCNKLISGIRCTDDCRNLIEEMVSVPAAVLLNECICDGVERPICEAVKENMARLCFGPDSSTGSSGSDVGDYYYDDLEPEERTSSVEETSPNSGSLSRIPGILTLSASILLLVPFL
ncbi:growth arrest-specific protein 1a [Erpetoichthys calabaricus]|nr:growth arrest-specific protein 1a [Erpetoichthys calabaricus]